MTLVAVPAAVGSAFCFGLTGALQHAAATQVRERAALRPGLLVDLAHRPIWLLSLAANVFGTVLQLVALDTGPLVLVQPTLVSGLLFGMGIRSLMRRRWPPPSLVAGAVLCVVGLSVFLLLSRPSGGIEFLTLRDALPLAVGLSALLAIFLTIASHYHGETRTLALAASAGVLYGVTAGLLKLVLGLVSDGGIVALFTHWPLYALIVTGPAGFLLNQNAYQSDKAMSPSLAVITVTDPLVGIGIGVLWLDEQLQSGAGAIIGQVLALITLVVGVWMVAASAPHMIAENPDQAGTSGQPGQLGKAETG
ncbi:MAG TPA: DMT family transporter [Pseudonocardiaceae bacterium]|nr:DMT family transporter [Pseudonocardiaceae bacterium]